MTRRWGVVALVLLGCVSAPARRAVAQGAQDTLQLGIQAYEALDFDAAAQLLRSGLASEAAAALAPDERGRFMTYLAATEVFRGNSDSAVAVFRRLAVRQPDYRVDELTFPPRVTEIFGEVQAELAAVRDRADRGFRAYADLDFDAAIESLQGVLTADSVGQFGEAERVRILLHIGAAEVYRGNEPAAIAALGRLATLQPEYRVDPLGFPPEVTQLFTVVQHQAEAVGDLVDRGVDAYGALDFDAAAWMLRRALASGGAQQLPAGERSSALTYLGAAEYYRGIRDSAVAAFRKVVLLDPTYRIDNLVFPPDVTAQFASARGEVEALRGLLDRGRRAYANRDYANTAGLLRRALTSPGAAQLPPSERAEALAYVGAADALRGAQSTAAGTFRALAVSDPQYRIDDAVFPPQVTSLFETARRQVLAVAVDAPAAAAFGLGEGALTLRLSATTPHDVTAEVRHRDGRPVRLLHEGPAGDSLELTWDGRDSSGVLVWDGRGSDGVVTSRAGYVISVSSRSADGQVRRRVEVPVEVDTYRQSALPPPPPPADSLFLPTRGSSGPGLEAVLSGVIGGAAIALLPSALAPGSELSPSRFAVGGAVSLAGLVGLIARFPGRGLDDNIRHNAAITDEWQRRVAAVERENATRLTEPHVVVHCGAPTVREGGAP